MANKNFNIVITGVGGQGLITLLDVISKAAFNKGLDIKTSELHGLSQRGGSVGVYIRFGKKVYSPMVPKTQANLVLALEFQEALGGLEFANKNTVFVINNYQTPTLGESASLKQVEDNIKLATNKIFTMPFLSICEKELDNSVVVGVAMLGFAIEKQALPLTKEEIIEAIKETMPEKFWELNLKALELIKE
ncbi:MAG: indolepyruvate oxidoreductase subunit beta [Candidatus Pacebacteria bacterium]|nr:indolepyruvate oxidoreductase subunit beta [Candidatus Paceibacterota bacterium]